VWISNGLGEALLGASEGRAFLTGVGVDWGSSAENNPAVDMRMPDEVVLIGLRIFIAYCNDLLL
jgi:hypothetical protein